MRRWQDVRADALASGLLTVKGIGEARRIHDERIRAHRMWVWDVALAAIVTAEVVALNSRAFPPLSKWLRRRLRTHTSVGLGILAGLFVWLAAHLRSET